LISNEDWIKKHISWLSFGKLRTSYGITGNDQIPDYQYLSTYGSSYTVYQNYAGLEPTRIANADFHWETTKKMDVGLDIGVAKDRIILTVDHFVDRSGDQLTYYTLPYITGFSGYEANLPAVVQNEGWEFALTTKNIQKTGFSWSTNFNLTTNKNTLESFPGLATSSYSEIYIIGQSILRSYGYQFTGVNPQTGASVYAAKSGGITANPSFDSYFFTDGDLNPTFYGGMSNSISIKNFQFDLFAQFAKHSLAGGIQNPPGQMTNNFQIVMNRWQTPGDVTNIPKPTTSVNDYYYGFSSANFFNASYVRIKTASLSYTFPHEWSKNKHIDKLRIYVQGENLLTFWNKNTALYDPESGINGVPPLRTIVMGFQITL